MSPHSLQALMALGRQSWDLGVPEKGGPVGHHCLVTPHCKSPQQSTAQTPVSPVTPILLQGGACRAEGSRVTARVGMLTPGKLSGTPKLEH